MAKLVDWTGATYGCYFVVKRVPKDSKATRWEVKCTYCGKENILWAGHMSSGVGKKCRCLSVKGRQHRCWTGAGKLSGDFFYNIRKNAGGAYTADGRRIASRKSREHIKFCVTIEDLWNLAVKQEEKCALSGELLVFGDAPRTASLDRIDSTKDYTLDNIQWVHKDINRMKNVFTEERFIEVCRLVAKHKEASCAGGNCERV